MTGAPLIRRATGADLPALARLLVEAVDGGASLSFVAPLPLALAEEFWAEPHPLLFVAEVDGAVAGCVELKPAWQPNAQHRAEVVKLLVSTRARRCGVGRALMDRCEAEARALGRTLLVLDTREGDAANQFYLKLGWTRAGGIPRYCRASGSAGLAGNVIYFKELA